MLGIGVGSGDRSREVEGSGERSCIQGLRGSRSRNPSKGIVVEVTVQLSDV